MADHKKEMQKKALTSRRKFISATALAGVGASVAIAEGNVRSIAKAVKSKHYGMVIDLKRCVGCHACTIACKSEFNVPLGVWRAWVRIKENGVYPHTRRSFVPKLCNNCRNSPCIKVCPTGASHYDENDVSSIDKTKCIGCKLCIRTCPYQQRFINPDTNTADKCTLCMHRVTQGLVPSCVNTCVGRARIFGDFNDPQSEVAKLIRINKVRVLKQKLGTQPLVYYIGDIDE